MLKSSPLGGGQVSLHDLSYLEVPMSELDEEDQINLLRHRSSQRWNRIVGIGICLAVMGAVAIAIIFYTERHWLTNEHHSDDDKDVCYLSPSCQHLVNTYDHNTGFTNLTGWMDSSTYAGCCDICQTLSSGDGYGPQLLLQETSSSSTASQANNSPVGKFRFNYEYVTFDLMWLPQFCHALDIGHDITVSHLSGSHCVSSTYQSTPRLSIHGVWPALLDKGSLFCCQTNGTVATLNALEVETWDIWKALQEVWFDPTTTETFTPSHSTGTESCSTCYLLNHEWQKHGSCFGDEKTVSHILQHSTSPLRSSMFAAPKVVEDTTEYRYFESGLLLYDKLTTQVNKINALAGQNISANAIQSMFIFDVNVICDPQDSSAGALPDASGNTIFSELQTCWKPRYVEETGLVDFDMFDCPKAYQSRFTVECAENKPIYLRTFATST